MANISRTETATQFRAYKLLTFLHLHNSLYGLDQLQKHIEKQHTQYRIVGKITKTSQNWDKRKRFTFRIFMSIRQLRALLVCLLFTNENSLQ